MKILLPPSETKRTGGSEEPLDLGILALPSLRAQREQVVEALVALSGDPAEARRILKLSERQLEDIAQNRMLRTSGTLPAVDRYTGVLYDALDAPSLDAAGRAFLGAHVWIHSAPFGPVGALDPIPSYRLAAGTSLPGVAPLRRHWAAATTAAIAQERPSFVLDLRSEAYAALGPVPASVAGAYVRVVTESGRALNHFNKKSKGMLLRALAEDAPALRGAEDLRGWADARGIVFRDGATPGEWEMLALDG